MKAIRNIVLVIMMLLLTSFGGEQQSPIYQHLGVFNYNFSTNTNVGLSSYVTKHHNVNKSYGGYRYVFYLKMISNSHNAGYLTSAWLYGTRVYVNGSEISFQQSPNGFTTYIKTTETIVYSWYTNDENMNYSVKWADAVYDPRNIR